MFYRSGEGVLAGWSATVTVHLHWLSAACPPLHRTSLIPAGENRHHCCWLHRMSTLALPVSQSMLRCPQPRT